MRKYLAIPLLLATFSAYGADWNFSLAPYIWGIDSELDTRIDQGAVEADFEDLIDNLDFAAQIHFEASTENWGVLADVTNLQVSDRSTQDFIQLDTDTEVSLVEVAGLWAIGNEETTRIEIIFGVRVLDVELELELETIARAPPAVSSHSLSETLIDGMVGLRHIQRFGERWLLSARGDVAAGDTNLTWNASLNIGYKLGPGVIVLGYRYMNVDFKGMDLLEPDLIVQGPQLGYSFQF